MLRLGRFHPVPGVSDNLLGELAERRLVEADTFAKVAREEGVGYGALQRANPQVDAWLPGEGTRILLPKAMLLPRAPREGVVINLAELRLYHFATDTNHVYVYPIGIGNEGAATPIMSTRIVTKIEQPTWYPPESIRARHAAKGDLLPSQVPPGPDNPLGDYALQLARPGYFIHGTNQPIGVGRRVSSGCIRMYAQDIEVLAHSVANGTPVRVIQQPYKVGWHEGALYLEAHTPDAEANYTDAIAQIIQATTGQTVHVDWDLALATVRLGSGLPVRISR